MKKAEKGGFGYAISLLANGLKWPKNDPKWTIFSQNVFFTYVHQGAVKFCLSSFYGFYPPRMGVKPGVGPKSRIEVKIQK